MKGKHFIISLLLIMCLESSLEAACCSEFEKARLLAVREGEFVSDEEGRVFAWSKLLKRQGKTIQYQIIYSPDQDMIALCMGGFFIMCSDGEYYIGAMSHETLLKSKSIEESEAAGYAAWFLKEIGR